MYWQKTVALIALVVILTSTFTLSSVHASNNANADVPIAENYPKLTGKWEPAPPGYVDLFRMDIYDKNGKWVKPEWQTGIRLDKLDGFEIGWASQWGDISRGNDLRKLQTTGFVDNEGNIYKLDHMGAFRPFSDRDMRNWGKIALTRFEALQKQNFKYYNYKEGDKDFPPNTISCVGLIRNIFWPGNSLPKDFLDPENRKDLPERVGKTGFLDTQDFYLYFWKNNIPDSRVKLYNELFGVTADISHSAKMQNTFLDLKSIKLETPKMPKSPEFKFPDFNLPDFKFPDFKLPELKFPTFKLPEFKFPEFKIPEMPKLPDFKLPEFKFPEMPKLPDLKFPEPPKLPETPKSPDFKIPEAPKLPDFKIPDLNIPVMPKFPNP
jgi:hypothetical protein